MKELKQKALELNSQDELKDFRKEFIFPEAVFGASDKKGPSSNERSHLYFAGHSLGLMPKGVRESIEQELEDWQKLGVEGHVHARRPWVPYHENITASFAHLTNSKASEVVAMNTLTVNLHLMLVSFYQPTPKRYKILIENNTFPSDKYAVDSQARFHGFDPSQAVVELRPDRDNGMTVSEQALIDQIKEQGDELALVMLGNCNYLSGQKFPFEKIVEAARSVGAMVGFNLAHGIGNLELSLHDWDIDFAVWCTYKYLNSGPGGIAGAFVHEKHHQRNDLNRFEGWWGHDKQTRFAMGPDFKAIPSVEAWQLSNPPIFQLAALKASLEVFDRATMPRLRKKSEMITSFLEECLIEMCGSSLEIVTPKERGSMLCVRVKKNPKQLLEDLKHKDVTLDFREPDILRMTPIALYNNFTDVFELSKIIGESLND